MNSNILLETGTNELEVLEFTIAGNSYGINVAKVKELMQYNNVRSLPNSHPCVEGVFQPRDELYTVLNLSSYLGLPESDNVERDIYIITSFNSMKVAFHVHGVESIHRFSWADVEKPDSIISGGGEGIVTGIVKIGKKIIAILDFEKITYDISPDTGIKLTELDERQKNGLCEKTILIAEDSILLRKLINESLHKAGYNNILSVTNGAEAWNMLDGFKAKDGGKDLRSYVACVITDIEMPQMDGLHLTKRIKEDPVLKQLPVVIFSSIIDEQMELKCQEVGAEAQLSKPKINQLVGIIDGLLRDTVQK
ncbi:MAG: chemotaxis protein [Oscillospiraceae bacterium]